MELLRCHIENFGNLKNYDCDLTGGMNGFLRENGWGKSTFAGFITAMFYGFTDTRKQDPDKNPYKKFDPWDGGAYGGSVDFRTADGEFRVERFAGTKSKGETFELTDLRTGNRSDRYSADIGVELFGVGRAAYECSAFISGGRIAADGEGVSGITERLSGLMDAIGDMDAYDGAVERLEEQRKYYERTGRRGRLAELDEEIAQADRDIENAKLTLANAENLEKRVAELSLGCDKLRSELDGCREMGKLAAKYDGVRKNRENIDRITAEKTAEQAKYDRYAGFFKGNIPDAGQLETIRDVAAKLRETRAEESARGLSEDDARQLSELSEKYFPDDEELDECAALARGVAELDAKLAGCRLSAREEETLKARSAEFAVGEPDTEKLDRLQSELERAPARGAKTAARGKFLAVGAVMLAVGAGCAIPGVILPVTALIIAGIVLLIGGCVSFVIAGRKGASRGDGREAIEKQLTEIYAGYGISCSGGAFGRAAERLAQDLDEYRRLTAAREGADAECRAISLEISEKRQRIAELLRTDDADIAGHISRVRLEKVRYNELADRKKREDALKMQLNGKINEYRRTLDGFFGKWYDLGGDADPDRLCADLGGRLSELENCKNRLENYEKTLKTLASPEDADTPIPEDLPDAATLEKTAERLRSELDGRQTERARLEKQIEGMYESCAGLQDMESVRDRLILEKQEGERRLKAIQNAKKLLEEARNNLSSRYLVPMKEHFAEYFDTVSGGEGLEFNMDTSFKVSLRMSGQYRKESGFSAGWRDAVGLCVRFAFIDALYTGERPVIILDDPFANLDEKRLENCKKLVAEFAKSYQTLYFTCSNERMVK